MTLNDLLKRVKNVDGDKMILFCDGKGWTNIDVEVHENGIMIVPSYNKNRVFSDDKK